MWCFPVNNCTHLCFSSDLVLSILFVLFNIKKNWTYTVTYHMQGTQQLVVFFPFKVFFDIILSMKSFPVFFRSWAPFGNWNDKNWIPDLLYVPSCSYCRSMFPYVLSLDGVRYLCGIDTCPTAFLVDHNEWWYLHTHSRAFDYLSAFLLHTRLGSWTHNKLLGLSVPLVVIRILD